MKFRESITPAVLTAATALLQPYAPDLNPRSLVNALKAFGSGNSIESNIPEKPLTRKETADLLGVSVNSVNRYVREGRITAIKISSRLVRINSESVRNLLAGNAKEA